MEASPSAQIQLTIEPKVFVYGAGGRDNLLFITASLIPVLHHYSIIRNVKVYEKKNNLVFLHRNLLFLPIDYS